VVVINEPNSRKKSKISIRNIRPYVAAEIKRAPIATLSILIGAIGGCLTFFFAGLQPKIPPSVINVAVESTGSVETRNILMVLSFFLFSSFLGAGIVKLLARKHESASILLSILIASLTNFSTIFLIYLAPPRVLSQQLFYAAHDNVFYASMVVYLIVCGAAVFKDLYRSIRPDTEKNTTSSEPKQVDGIGFLFIAVILIALWGWAVFAGQKRLTDIFLPEITHYTEKVSDRK